MSIILPHTDLNTLHNRLIEEIPPGSSVLDVGAGLAKYHPILLARGCTLTLIDAHEPYLWDRQETFYTAFGSGDLILIHDQAERRLEKIPEGAYDVVLAIDFLEHLDRPAAQRVAGAMCRVAPKAILFVPEGNHPQEIDHYGMGADHWQTHRSIWQAEDLEALGFTVERWVDFHRWNPKSDPGALWATWRRA